MFARLIIEYRLFQLSKSGKPHEKNSLKAVLKIAKKLIKVVESNDKFDSKKILGYGDDKFKKY